MKYIVVLSVMFVLAACRQQESKIPGLQAEIDSLKHQLDNAYKPGFGEFMGNIQVHHDKLWFAGINNNWDLAEFEINEIKESLDDITKYCTDRPETNSIDMIEQPLQNVSNAIQGKNIKEFKNSFMTLTSTCNSCHQATKHEFNVIIVPSTPPFSNQSFKAVQ